MKHAVFFCENCGKPVPLDAEQCPHCRSRFTAVQCPQCSFTGEAQKFASGCPRCGYQPEEGLPTRTAAASSKRNPAPRSEPHGQGGTGSPSSRLRPLRTASRMPRWFYTVASIVLIMVVVALIVVILNLK